MKNLFKLLTFLSCISFASAKEESSNTNPVPLKPLIEAMEKGGLASVNTYLDEGGKWPRITTDSFALENKIFNHKELSELSEKIIRMIRDRAETEPSLEIKVLESEAELFFSLSEKLWKAGGYRNRVVSLLCGEIASHRCGKIVVLSNGKKMGPSRPKILKINDSVDMLDLFITMLPENAGLSDSGLSELLQDKPIKKDTWLEIIAALRKIEIAGTTVGGKFDKSVTLGVEHLGVIDRNENINSLVLHYGWSQLRHEEILPALAMYLKNGGSLEMLMKEPANETKFKEVMGNEAYQFSMTPVMSGRINGDQVAVFVEDIQSPRRFSERLFGLRN